MKKLILPLALAGFFAFTSCKKDEAKTEETTVVPTEDGATAVTTETNVATVDGMPTFSSPEVTEFAAEWTTFMREMTEAYKNQDAAAIQKLAATQNEWTTKASTIATKFTPEDSQKWADWSQKVTGEMQTAMMTK